MRWFGLIFALWACLVGGKIPGAQLLAEVPERTRLALETLNRLRGPESSTNAALQQAASRIADQIKGEPEFVELVVGFQLKGREAELMAYASTHPDLPQAAEAIRWTLNGNAADLMVSALSSNEPSRRGLLEAMAASGDSRCLPLVRPLVDATNQPGEIRALAMRVMASSSEGASNLLTLSRSSVLPPDLREASGALLRACRWPEIRAAAPAATVASEKATSLVLPPLSQLMDLPGDSRRGREVFRRADVGCSGCHQVRGEGVDFGPKLSEIGAKLGKDALISAIVDPSAGISFGFEAWRITLKDGDELLGLVASETEDELLLKQQGGQVMAIRKANIASREKQTTSIMPSGLHENLSLTEFVDLIAYLASLKAGMPLPE